MPLTSSVLLIFSISLTYACDCTEPSVPLKRTNSDLIFRGTISSLRDADPAANLSNPLVHDTKKIAVFRVTRVWKGDVGQTFEMPAVEETTACIGFWPDSLKVGSDLLIYARRNGGPEYYTSICGFHKLAKNAKDLRELGPGEEPKKPIISAPSQK